MENPYIPKNTIITLTVNKYRTSDDGVYYTLDKYLTNNTPTSYDSKDTIDIKIDVFSLDELFKQVKFLEDLPYALYKWGINSKQKGELEELRMNIYRNTWE